MFTRTLSVGGVLEVRPSPGAAPSRIRSSAGVQITRLLSSGRQTCSWPRSRPIHTSLSDSPYCSAVRQYPGLLAVLGHASAWTTSNEITASSVAQLEDNPNTSIGQEISEAEPDIPEAAKRTRIEEMEATAVRQASSPVVEGSTMSASNAVRDMFLARAAACADLARPPVRGLERRCAELYAETQQLKAGLNAAADRIRQVQDLNLRLCSELKTVRDQHDAQRAADRRAAVHKISGLRRQMRRRGHQCLRLRRLLRLRTYRRARVRRAENCSEEGPAIPSEITDAYADDSIGSGFDAETTCKCGQMYAWGCSLHCVYSDKLLLAHRDVGRRISLGPPGLELPDGAPSPTSSGLHLVALANTRKQRQGVHRRRQPRKQHLPGILEELAIVDRPPGL